MVEEGNEELWKVAELIQMYCFFALWHISELQSGYLPAAPHHLGYKYKKVVYVEYTDGSFTQRKNPANALLGPLLKGKVNDQIYVSQMFEDRKYTKIGLLCMIKFELKQEK